MNLINTLSLSTKLSLPGIATIILIGLYFSINILHLVIICIVKFIIILLITLYLKKDWDNFNQWLKKLTHDSKNSINSKSNFPIIDNSLLANTMKLVSKINENHIKSNADNSEKNIRFSYIIDNYWHPVIVINRSMTIIYINHLVKGIFPTANIGENISIISREPKLIPVIEKIFKNKPKNNNKIKPFSITNFNKNKLYTAVPIFISAENLTNHEDEIAFILKPKENKKSEEIKTDFIADASHELRTPLTVIKNTTELLKNVDDKKTKNKFLNIANKQINNMTKLLDKLIELSRIENAAKVKNSSVTDIKKVITDSINQRKQIVAANNQILTYTKSKKITILAEESDVSTIINNIIDNAIKYSGKNSKINITTSIIENKNNKELVLVKIKDNGIGIEEKHLPKIKDRFYRVDKARSKSSNSSGLGLSIVKSLLEKNKGKFDIFSIFGKGTEVCLYFNKFIK